MNLGDLAQLALLGTSRQGLPAVSGSDALSQLLRRLDASRRERAFLSATTLVALHERAGLVPAKDVAPAPAPCPEETRATMSVPAATLLRRILEGEHAALLLEALELASAAQVLAPPELAPALLDAASARDDLRELSLAVGGERARWLGAQDETWSWVAGGAPDESAWTEGAPDARVLYLRRLRGRDPARGLALLAEGWKDEAPDERADLVAELATGLGPDDEGFLESALDDKRKEVRRAAATLLARLPDSAFVARLAERTAPLLSFTPGESGALLKLKRAKKPRLEVTLPSACDKAMQRDGIEPKPPSGLGEKAWWLTQMLAALPLSTWTRAWSATPGDILTAATEGESEELLLRAFARAALAQRDAAWAGALIDHGASAVATPALPALIDVLPPRAREERIGALLGSALSLEACAACLASCTHAWSAPFSRDVLAWLRRLSAGEPRLYWTRPEFEGVALRLAPEALPTVAEGWPTESRHWAAWSRGIDTLLSTAQLRAALHASFNRSGPERIDGGES